MCIFLSLILNTILFNDEFDDVESMCSNCDYLRSIIGWAMILQGFIMWVKLLIKSIVKRRKG